MCWEEVSDKDSKEYEKGDGKKQGKNSYSKIVKERWLEEDEGESYDEDCLDEYYEDKERTVKDEEDESIPF